MCPGAHSLGPPGGLCESRPYRNCPPIRNGIPGGRWKSALHNMPCRIVSERHRQNRPYRAYQAFLVADRRSRQQLQLGNRHSRRQLSPLQSLRPPLGGAISNVKTYSEKAEASRDGRKLRRATQSSGESFPRPCPKLRCVAKPRRKTCATCALETCPRPIVCLRTCAGHTRRATSGMYASRLSVGQLNHVV